LTLAGTLLTLSLQVPNGDFEFTANDSVSNTVAIAFPTSPLASVAQSLLRAGGSAENPGDDGEESTDLETETEDTHAPAPARAGLIWIRYLLGVDVDREPPPPDHRASPPPADGDGPSALLVPGRRASLTEALDQVLQTLGTVEPTRAGATRNAPHTSPRHAIEQTEIADSARAGFPKAGAESEDRNRPSALPEPDQGDRIDLSLSVILAAVGTVRYLKQKRKYRSLRPGGFPWRTPRP